MTRAEHYPPLPDDAATRWAKFGRSDVVYFPSLLGIEVEEVRTDYCRMRMPFHPDLKQSGGVVHGGAIAALLDHVVVPAVGGSLPADARYSTVDFHVQYLGVLVDEDALAEGWVVKRGRRVVFCESEIRGATSDRVLARGMLTYNVSPPSSPTG